MAFGDIPIRENRIDLHITAEWFNTIRTELISAFGSAGYITESDLQSIVNDGSVTIDSTKFKQMIPVVGNGGAITLNALPFGGSHGLAGGKEIILLGTSDTNTVTLQVNDAVNGFYSEDGDVELKRGTLVLLVWSDELQRFVIGSGAGGAKVVGKHEEIGTGNGVQVGFSLSTLPLDEDSFIVYRNGVKVPKSQYTFSNPTITFNTAPAAGQKIDVWILTTGSPALTVTKASNFVVQYHTVTAGEVAAQQITMPSTPSDPTKVILDLVGGTSQIYGTDFVVAGTSLDWSGLGLDGVITTNDVLRYWYFTT